MLRIRVSNKQEHQEIEHASGPFEIGRGPARNNVPRCILQDLYMSKDHICIVELEDGRVRIDNLSKRNTIRLDNVGIIEKGASREAAPPIHLAVGETTVDIERPQPASDDRLLQVISSPFPRLTEDAGHTTLMDLGHSPSPEKLTLWFETVIAVQRAAAGSQEFFQQTARAVVTLVGLDRGLVLLRREGRWMVKARFPDEVHHHSGREFSVTTLERIARERKTVYQSAWSSANPTESLQGIEAVAAAPILDSHDRVVGAVYGCRSRITPHAGLGIGPLEAQVMQVLASVVGIGLARQEQETRATRRLVQLEQFFPGDMAREMEQDPHVLDGQEREVTVLFSDIRGFSRMAEKLGPMDTFRLAAEVMDRLTARVQETGGVVVHYAGDGLMALWNAPKDVHDHAARACRTALGMLADQPAFDADWQERLGGPVRLGIGLNTGLALCGNTGSKQKFHYGALGHAVNVASRVEGATKQLGIPIILTGSTHAQLIGEDAIPNGSAAPTGFATRRLCRVRLPGIDGATELYELHSESAPQEWQEWCAAYERGLALYEAGRWLEACRTLHTLLFGEAEHDRPTLMLLARATKNLQEPPQPFDAVIDLEHK